jgi:hypothetical protein
MTRKTVGVGLALALGMALLFGWLSRQPIGAQEEAPPAVQKWEYKVVLPDDALDPRKNEAQFNRLGADGWELCAAQGNTSPNYCIFKRPKR